MQPVNYIFEDLYTSSRNPNSIHTVNTGLHKYYCKYLFNKLLSVFKFEGLPETWPKNYFQYYLLGLGYIAIFKDDKYGVIPQKCIISDTYTLFYQPKDVIVTNPFIRKQRYTIGKECELIKLQPDYSSPFDIISMYADLMAVALETAGVNLMNSKASFVFFANNKATAESFKQLYDEIGSGKPFTVVDKDLLTEEGGKSWDFFTQDLSSNYITSKILDDLKTIEDQFNTRIGIPNANTQKRERLISSEVEANDIDTQALVNVWLDTLQDGIDRVNKKYNLNLSVQYRYKNYYNENKEVDNEQS